MPLQNRVTPTGDIISHPSREACFMGNRGILHDEERSLGRARWKHHSWVICELSFKGWKRMPMSPGNYTELFFLDEAVALAAGHRPCGECRHEAYRHFLYHWQVVFGCGQPKSAVVDATLHAARVERGTRQQRRHVADIQSLPDGVFVEQRDEPGAWLVMGGALHRYSPAGYDGSTSRPKAQSVTVLTPEPTVRVLASGYTPSLHAAVSG